MNIPKNHIYIILGIGLCLLFIIWLLTSPAIYNGFNYTQTGNIGDTIGGITAPFIGIIGAYLVYTSFQAQLAANRLQLQALQTEITKGDTERIQHEQNRIFQQHQLALDEIKRAHNNLSFAVVWVEIDHNGADMFVGAVTYNGLDALEQFLYRLESLNNNSMDTRFFNERYSAKGLYFNFLYVLTSTKELYERMEGSSIPEADKIYFFSSLITLYQMYIEPYIDRLKNALPGDDAKKISEIDDDLKALLLL